VPAFVELDPRFRPWAQELVALAERLGFRPRVTSTRRSLRAQTILWERRQRVLRGELPVSAQPFQVAQPGTSTHELGLAIDLVVREPGGQAVLGDVWRSWGGVWSGGDAIHYGAGPDQLLKSPRVVTRGGRITAAPLGTGQPGGGRRLPRRITRVLTC